MQGKKADTKTVLLSWNNKFQDIYDMKSAVERDPLWVFWFGGNLLFHNKNTVFVSAFLSCMDFKSNFSKF